MNERKGPTIDAPGEVTAAPAAGRPSGSVVVDRELAVRAGLAATLLGSAVCLLTVVAQAFYPGNTAPQWCCRTVVLVSLTSIVLSLWSRAGSVPQVVLGLAMGAAVAVPWTASEFHPWPDGSVFSLAMGATITAGILTTAMIRPRQVTVLVSLTLTAIVGICFLMGLAQLSGLHLNAFYLLNDRDWVGFWQLRGFLGHPNTLGILVCLAIVVQVGLWRRLATRGFTTMESRRQRTLVMVALMVSGVTLVWTQSRTGWLACVGALLVLLLPFQRLKHAAAWVAGLLALAAATVAVPPLLALLGAVFNGRYLAWATAEESFTRSPLDGSGAYVFSPQFWQTQPATPWEPGHAHNQLLQTASLLGALGVVTLVVAVGAAWWISVGSFGAGHRIAAACFVVLAAFAGIEPVLGVGTVAASYLPALSTALLFGAAWESARRARKMTPPSAIPASE